LSGKLRDSNALENDCGTVAMTSSSRVEVVMVPGS
jgi:hypothetical protein